ncbi:ABC transporter permease [Haloferacaceae archaeon DSL9]
MISPRVKRSLKRELRTSRLAQFGLVVLILMLLMATLAPFLALHNPYEQSLDRNHEPPVGFTKSEETTRLVDGESQRVQVEVSGSLEYPFGTDHLGRDLFSRVIYGARTSMLVGFIGAAIATTFGVAYGLAAGYYGGRVDDTLMRGADIMLAFPSLVLAVALVGLFGGSPIHVIWIPDPFVRLGLVEGMPESFALPGTLTLVVALVNWVWFARVARGEALSIRSEEYVKAARSVGASDREILLQHVLPNSLTPIIVLTTIQVAAIILLESALSYLGFSGTTLSWGFDIAEGRSHLAGSWWIATMPGLAIVFAVISVNLIGDWFRDALDPSIEGEGGV